MESERFDFLKNFEYMKPLFEQAYNSIVVTTSQLELPGPQIIYANRAFCEHTGYTLDELIGETPRILQGEKTDRAVLDELKETLKNGDFFQGSTINYRKDGSEYWVEWNISAIHNHDGVVSHYFCVQHDITALKEIEIYKNHLQELVDEKTKTILELNLEIENTLKDTLFMLGGVAEGKSKETGLHVKRVAKYSKLLGELYGLSEKDVELLKLASTLHDIGKMSIPDAILHKPGKLTKEEFENIKTHSASGYDMLKSSDRELFKVAASIALSHHERYDGKGYPEGLEGEDIDLFGRIVAVADVFDALSHKRCYKDSWSDEQIVEYFTEQCGKQFDPKIASLFLENYGEFVKLRETYKEWDLM